MAFKALSENLNIAGEKAQDYLENTADYYKLRLFKSSMKFATSLINMLVLGSVALLLLAFLSVGLAIYLSRITGYPSAGFFIVGGFYFILLLLIAFFGKGLITKNILAKFSELVVEDEEPSAKHIAEENTEPSLEEKNL